VNASSISPQRNGLSAAFSSLAAGWLAVALVAGCVFESAAASPLEAELVSAGLGSSAAVFAGERDFDPQPDVKQATLKNEITIANRIGDLMENLNRGGRKNSHWPGSRTLCVPAPRRKSTLLNDLHRVNEAKREGHSQCSHTGCHTALPLRAASGVAGF
jgi:hypothetical protein